MLRQVQIPQHADSILTSRSAERTIGGNGNGGDVTSVTKVVGSEFALGQLPNLRLTQETRVSMDRSGKSRIDSNSTATGVISSTLEIVSDLGG